MQAGGDEPGVQPVGALGVVKTPAIQSQHLTTGPFHYGLGGGGIPLAGGGKTRVEIGAAFGQYTELERAADIGQLQATGGLQAFEQGFLVGTAVAAAGDHPQGLGGGATADRLGGPIALPAPAAQPGAARSEERRVGKECRS